MDDITRRHLARAGLKLLQEAGATPTSSKPFSLCAFTCACGEGVVAVDEAGTHVSFRLSMGIDGAQKLVRWLEENASKGEI